MGLCLFGGGMIKEQKDRKRNPYYGYSGYEEDVAEDDYSEESDADSVYIESC